MYQFWPLTNPNLTPDLTLAGLEAVHHHATKFNNIDLCALHQGNYWHCVCVVYVCVRESYSKRERSMMHGCVMYAHVFLQWCCFVACILLYTHVHSACCFLLFPARFYRHCHFPWLCQLVSRTRLLFLFLKTFPALRQCSVSSSTLNCEVHTSHGATITWLWIHFLLCLQSSATEKLCTALRNKRETLLSMLVPA